MAINTSKKKLIKEKINSNTIPIHKIISSQTKMKLSSQKYEQLIHEYQSKISSILKINNELSNEANDLINSIYLNRDIICEYLKDFPEFKPL